MFVTDGGRMNLESTTRIDRTTDLQDTSSDLLRIVYSSISVTLTAVFINSAILSYIQWDVIAHTTILTWFCLVNAFSLIRFVLYKKFKALSTEKVIPQYWHSITLATSIISGMLWGSVAIWLFPENMIAYQVFLAFVLTGMCAGAVTTLSSRMRLSIAFIVLAMLPLITRFFLEGTTIALAMVLMATLFTVMILVMSKKMNRTLKESLLIRQKNILAEDSLHYNANYDVLTDLPNRRQLGERLKQEINRSIRHDSFGAVLFLDVDRFKTINDSLGHNVGDELLKNIAQRIKSRVREQDTLARLGGDEFVILLSEVDNNAIDASDNTMKFADEILHLFDNPFNINNHVIYVTTSIGATIFPFSGITPENILQKSDLAMYEAKDSGRNTARLFLPDMQKIVNERRVIERGLHSALDNDEFVLYYQPQVDVNNNTYGVEALIRWNHPDRGLINPDEFIDIAEKSGIIIPIGEWVLKTACEQISEYSLNNDLTICINISPIQFSHSLFVDKVEQIIEQTGVDPNKVQLEITENMVLKDIDETINKMMKLKTLGLSFSIDDFGTGYSSLAYLKRLPIDMLKIDKSFVLDVINDTDDAAIVEAIIAMAKHMKIDVVAEGVETEEVVEFLKSKCCYNYQGHYFEKPMPLDDLNAYFNNTYNDFLKIVG